MAPERAARAPRRPPPDPLDLARALSPHLRDLPWAIAGSVLLRDLGLKVRPRDLDLVTTIERFDEVAARLAEALGPGERPPHDTLRSAGFVRFANGSGPAVDLMAGVRAHVDGAVREWAFDPRSVEHRAGLPWLRGADWSDVYELLGRHDRAEQLRRHVDERR